MYLHKIFASKSGASVNTTFVPATLTPYAAIGSCVKPSIDTNNCFTSITVNVRVNSVSLPVPVKTSC